MTCIFAPVSSTRTSGGDLQTGSCCRRGILDLRMRISRSAPDFPFRRGVCTWIHHAVGMGSLANARTALANELRAVSRFRPWCFDCGPQAAASAHVTRARRRTGSRRRRMEQRCLLGGLRSGALEEGRERRTRGQRAGDEAGRTRGPSGRSKGRDSDAS